MKKIRLLSYLAIVPILLALILVACSGTKDEVTSAFELDISHDESVAGFQAVVSYTGKFEGLTAGQGGLILEAADQGDKVIVVGVASDGSTDVGSLASLQFAEGQASVTNVEYVSASSEKVSAQAINISDVNLDASMANSDLGDVTGGEDDGSDGAVDVFDSVLINRIAKGIVTGTDAQKVLADMDGNNTISEQDVILAAAKAANFGSDGLEANLVAKPSVLTLADSNDTGLVLTFNGGTAPLPSLNVTGATATARAEAIENQSGAWDVSAAKSGPMTIDAAAAGERVVSISVESDGGNTGGGSDLTAYYIDGNGDRQSIPADAPSTDFVFYSWLEDEGRGVNTSNLGELDPASTPAQINDEREERAPPYTQNLAAAFVGYRVGGTVYPVVNAKVRWLITPFSGSFDVGPLPGRDENDISQFTCNRNSTNSFCFDYSSMFFGTSDDDNIDNSQADTWTNDANGVNVPFPTPNYNENFELNPNGPYPTINRTGIANPNRNGLTWVTLFSPDVTAARRLLVVATVNGTEVTKQTLVKEFRGAPDFIVEKLVLDNADRIVSPGEPVTFRITIRNRGSAAGAPVIVDRLRTDEVDPDPNWLFVDNVVDVYRLIDLPYTGNYNHATDTAADIISHTAPAIAVRYFDANGGLIFQDFQETLVRGPDTNATPPNNQGSPFGTNGGIAQNVLNSINRPDNQFLPLFLDQGHEDELNKEYDELGSGIDDPNGVKGVNADQTDDFYLDAGDGYGTDYEGFNYRLSSIPAGGRADIWVSAVADRENDTYCNIVSIRGVRFLDDQGNPIDIDFTASDELSDEGCFEVRGPNVVVDKGFLDENGNFVDNRVVSRGQTVTAVIRVENRGETTAYDIVLDDDLYTVDGVQVRGTGANRQQVGDYPYEDEKDVNNDGVLDNNDTFADIDNPAYVVLDPDPNVVQNVPNLQSGVYRQLECDVRDFGENPPMLPQVRPFVNTGAVPTGPCINSGWNGNTNDLRAIPELDDDGIQDWQVVTSVSGNPNARDNDLEPGESLEYRFNVRLGGDDTDGSTFCDYARVYYDVEERRDNDNRIAGDEACLSIINLVIDKIHLNAQGDLIERIPPGSSYISQVTVTNNGGGTVNDVLVSDILGQGDVFKRFVDYDRSSFPGSPAEGTFLTLADGTEIVFPPVENDAATNQFARYRTYDIPAGGSIVFRVVSNVPLDYPADNVCDKARYQTPLGIEDTDSECIIVTSSVALQTQMVDQDGDPFDVGDVISFDSLVFNEENSNEPLTSNVIFFSFPREGYTINATRVYIDTNPAIDATTNSVNCRPSAELSQITNATIIGNSQPPPNAGGIDRSGQWQEIRIPRNLNPGDAFCFEHDVTRGSAAVTNTFFYYQGTGVGSASVIQGTSSETTTVQ